MSRMTGMTSFAPRRLAGSPMSAGGVFASGRGRVSARQAGNVTAVCLLIALFGVVPSVPLLIAANRDEMYQRPADPITVLRGAQPRILGGRDEQAGGTWLAVNENGVVAGLTNQPVTARDPARRSRGELPLAFTAYPDAKTAVTEVCARLDPAAYNPCWMLVGDRHALFSVDLSGGHRAGVEELPPGRYVLENAPLRQPSAKQQRVAGLVAALEDQVSADPAAAAAGSADPGLADPGLAGPGLAAPAGGARRGGLRRGSRRCSGITSPRPGPSRPRRPGPPGRTVGRVRAHRALRHPLGHDRQRRRGRPAPGERGGRAALRDPAAGCVRDVGITRGRPGRFALIARMRGKLTRGRRAGLRVRGCPAGLHRGRAGDPEAGREQSQPQAR